MKLDDGISAIPLWIDGHAYFNVFDDFIDIRQADGEVRLRVPKCGAAEVGLALASAGRAQPGWSADAAERQRLIAELAGLLDQFGGDFGRLLAPETGKDTEAARAEVAQAVDALKTVVASNAGAGITAVIGGGADSFRMTVSAAAAALASGDAVVVLSDARAPSAVFALAELTARAGFPAGVFCLLHGDAETGAALKATAGLRVVGA